MQAALTALLPALRGQGRGPSLSSTAAVGPSEEAAGAAASVAGAASPSAGVAATGQEAAAVAAAGAGATADSETEVKAEDGCLGSGRQSGPGELEGSAAGAQEASSLSPSPSSPIPGQSASDEARAELEEKLRRVGPPVSSLASRERQLRQACVQLLKNIVVPERGKAD